MTLTPEDREFIVFCTDMRLKGVHPAWLPVFRGAYMSRSDPTEWLRSVQLAVDNGTWPTVTHTKEPNPTFHNFFGHHSEAGRKWWDQLNEEGETQ